MPVLPVWTIASSAIPSARRFCRAIAVGGRWTSASRPIRRRFISSGNGSRGVLVRRPASTCHTGTPA
jgi:hypothetical protein